MIGWLSVLKGLLGLFSKFLHQKKIKVVNELKLESYKLHKRKLENEALKKANDKISNFRSYLNKP